MAVDYWKWSKLTWNSLFVSWWVPSTHGTLTSSLMMLVFLTQWWDSVLFAVVSIFSFLIWYDACNVRYESGKHAHYINSLQHELNQVLMLEYADNVVSIPYRSLKERIGHTPLEVLVGIMYGMSLTWILMQLL